MKILLICLGLSLTLLSFLNLVEIHMDRKLDELRRDRDFLKFEMIRLKQYNRELERRNEN